MLHVNIHQAKTNLSKYLEKVTEGEEVIICKNGKPIATLKPYEISKKKRKFGEWKGKVWMADDFDDLPKDFMEHFE